MGKVNNLLSFLPHYPSVMKFAYQMQDRLLFVFKRGFLNPGHCAFFLSTLLQHLIASAGKILCKGDNNLITKLRGKPAVLPDHCIEGRFATTHPQLAASCICVPLTYKAL